MRVSLYETNSRSNMSHLRYLRSQPHLQAACNERNRTEKRTMETKSAGAQVRT
jgi:hypothetical protein